MKEGAPPEPGRHDQRLQRVQPAEVAEDEILRDEDDMIGDHQRRQHQDEQHIPPWEAQPGEPVGGQACSQQAAHHHTHNDRQRVEPGYDKGKLDERIRIVDPLKGARDEVGRIFEDLRLRFDRTADQPDQRSSVDQRQCRHRQIDHKHADTQPPPARRLEEALSEQADVCLGPQRFDQGRAHRLRLLALIVDNAARNPKTQQGEHQNNDDQHPGQRRSVAHIEVFPAVAIKIEDIE